MIKDFSNHFLDLINPLLCLVCENPITERNNSYLELVCSKCFANIPSFPSSHEIINHIKGNFEPNTFSIDIPISLIDVRKNSDFLKIIHALKYYSIKKVADIFGKELAKLISKYIPDIDFIIPVPIHKAKKRERGFNQSSLIACVINQELNIPILEDFIIRKEYTTSQTLLNHDQRKENIKRVYDIKKLYDIENKNILLVDDVLTTGSTLNNIAIILKSLNSGKIYSSTIAFA